MVDSEHQHGLRQCVLSAMLFALASSPMIATAQPSPRQWDEAQFKDGLLELRLLDLLDYHLRVSPPQGDLESLLIQREMKLARRDDPDLDPDQRQRLLSEANVLLERVLNDHPSDPRSLDWQMELARSLLYEEAEPYSSSILYRGPTDDNRQRLEALMRRATAVLSGVLVHLQAEYERLDELSIRAYERLEQSGYVNKIESAMPEAQYMLRWARFYLGLSLPPRSREHKDLMVQVLTELRDQSVLLKEDHGVTHVQAQSLLLAGMASRLLGDYPSAINYLGSAVTVTSAISDPQERQDLQWVATLGSIERIRTLRDSGRYDAARSAAKRLANLYEGSRQEDFGMQLVIALLQTSVEIARADDLEASGKSDQAEAARAAAMSPLAQLAKRNPTNRDEIYMTVYEMTRGTTRAFQPFERCAMIAGQIAEATRVLRGGDDELQGGPRGELRQASEASAIALLDEAIANAKTLLAESDSIDPQLGCEARFNLAVAQYQRGLRFEAAGNFQKVAASCDGFWRGESAAGYAVEIASQLAEDGSLGRRTDVRELYVSALRTLVHRFGDSDAAAYWRFFLAQALEDAGERIEAARLYESVYEDHPYYRKARFRAARCLIEQLKTLVRDHPEKIVEIRRQSTESSATMRRFLDSLDALQLDSTGGDSDRLRAEGTVLLAEVGVLPGVNDPQSSLDLLEGFERRFSGQHSLLGRVLRTRIIALEASGRLQEARAAVPSFISSAPKEAGATLQALFDSTWTDVKRLRQEGRFEQARKKAESALLFAQQLYEWGQNNPQAVSDDHRYYLDLQLAEANLEAGRLADALRIFESLAAKRQDNSGQPDDSRVLMGLAEVMYRSGRYGEALPKYNRLFKLLPVDDERRFEALLRDLQCRTELGHDPKAIADVIKQHRFLTPDLGGDRLKSKFLALLERNEARLARQ